MHSELLSFQGCNEYLSASSFLNRYFLEVKESDVFVLTASDSFHAFGDLDITFA